MGWIEYWDGKPTIYVNRRHREAHYRSVANGLIANLGEGRPVVLDYGCGEALCADEVARHCGRLYLCDAAPSVRAELQRRFEAIGNIVVVAPEDLADLPADSLDLIVANSVIQYLSPVDLDRCLDQWKRLLAPTGRLLVADVIPPSVGPLTDALALLDFGRHEGFLLAAGAGLVRTFFSGYRKMRAALGLQQYEAPTFLGHLAAHGLAARRHHPNLGHNQSRMAFIATRAGAESLASPVSVASLEVGVLASVGVDPQAVWRTCACVVFGLWLLFASPWLLGHVTIPYDAKALFQAQLQFLASALHSGQSPAWNPHTFLGVPQIADPQSLIFSPAFLLAALDRDPGLWVLDVYVFVLLGLGAAAVLLLFRDRGWHPGGAAVAALCFAFGGSASWRMQHIGQVQSYAFFALTLWLLSRARTRRSPAWSIAAGIAAGLMLVQPSQVALLACYLLVVIVVAEWLTAPVPSKAFRRDIGPCLGAAAVALAIAAAPLVLTYVYVADSNRPSIAFAEAARGSLHPASLLTLLLPDLFGINDSKLGYWGPYSHAWDSNELTLSPNMSQLYMGALPILVLLQGALTRGALRRPEIVGFSAAALVALVYALGSFTPVFRLAYETAPGVDLFRRPADATFMLGGMLAILAGYLVHRHLSDPTPSQRITSLRTWGLILAAVALGAGMAFAHGRLSVSLVAIAIGVAMLAIARSVLSIEPGRLRFAGRIAVFVPALLVGADLMIANGPSESTGKPADRAQRALELDTTNETVAFLSRHVRRTTGTPWRDRIEIAGVGFDWQNAAEAHGLDQTLGYNPLRTSLVTRALGAGDYIAGYDQRTFSRLFPSYRSRLADLLGLRFIATPVPISAVDPRLREDDLHFIGRTPDAYIYENPRVLPRVLFAEHSITADFERLLASGRWPEFDPRRTVIFDQSEKPVLRHRQPLRTMSSVSAETALTGLPPLAPLSTDLGEPNDPLARGPHGTQAEVAIARYENTRVDVDVTAPRPGFLVLNDVWHPWWRATVDGVAARIQRANVLFRAVSVPAGRHKVRFEFYPISGAFSALSHKLMPGRR